MALGACAATALLTSCQGSISPSDDAHAPTLPGIKMETSASAATVVERARLLHGAAAPARSRKLGGLAKPQSFNAVALSDADAAHLDGAAIRAHFRGTAAATTAVVYPSTSDGRRTIALKSGESVALALSATAPASAEYASGFVVYRGGLRAGGDVLTRPTRDGFEDYFYFEQRPATSTIEYSIALPKSVAGLRLSSNVLEFVDAHGVPLVHASPPFLVDSAGKQTRATLTVAGCAVDKSAQPSFRRAPTPPGATNCRISVSWDDAAVRYPAVLDPNWSMGNTMAVTVADFDVQVLRKQTPQQVVAFGGVSGDQLTNVTQFFDADSGNWSVGPPLNIARAYGASAYFNNTGASDGDRILTVGGVSGPQGSSVFETSTELLSRDAAGQWSWSLSAQMQQGVGREAPTATLIGTKVLIAGGVGATTTTATCELYDTTTGTFASPPPPPMGQARGLHRAVPSPDGQSVLVVSGYDETFTMTSTAEIFVGGNWVPLPPMPTQQFEPNAVQLADGRALFAGTWHYIDADQDGAGISDVSLFTFSTSPPYGSWSSGESFNSASTWGPITLLANGGVLMGPLLTMPQPYGPWIPTTDVRLYDPSTGHWSTSATAIPHDAGGSATLTKSDGSSVAVVFGGFSEVTFDYTTNTGTHTYTNSTEIFTPAPKGQPCTAGPECATGICLGSLCQPQGFPITINAAALTNKGLSIPGVLNGAVLDTNGPPLQLNLAAGTYNLQTVPGVASAATFTIKPDGTIQYDPALEGVLTGQGGTMLTVNGRTITVDATHLSQQTIEILADHFVQGANIGHVAFATTPACSFTLLPLADFGYHVTLDDGLPSDLAFNVDIGGNVHIAPASTYLATGENTPRLTIGGAHVSITIPAGLGDSIVDGIALPAGQTRDLYILPYSGGNPLMFQLGALTVSFTVDSAGDVIGDPELIAVFGIHGDGGAFCSSIGTQGSADGWQLDGLGCRGITITDGTGDLVPPTPVTTPAARAAGQGRPPNQLPPFRKKAGGDPVLGDGEFTFQRIDTSFGGAGLLYQFGRAYRSGLDNDGPLGPGWDHNYDQRIIGIPIYDEWSPSFDPTTVGDVIGPDCKGTVQLQDGAGNLQEFTSVGWGFVPGTNLPVQRFGATTGDYVLEHMLIDAQSWRLTRPDGSVSIFDRAGFLFQTSDLAGNKIAFTWSRATAPPMPDCTGVTPAICTAWRNDWKTALMKDPVGQRRRLAVVNDPVRQLFYVYDQKDPVHFTLYDRLKCVTPTAEDCTSASTILSFGYGPSGTLLTSIARGPIGTAAFETYAYHAPVSDAQYCLPSGDIPTYCTKLCNAKSNDLGCDNLNWDAQVRGKCSGLYCEPLATCDLVDPQTIGGDKPGALCCNSVGGGGYDPLCLNYFFHAQDCFEGCEDQYNCIDNRNGTNYAIFAGGVSRYLNNDITDVYDNTGKLVVHNDYGTDRALVSFDKVTSQTLGSGTADNTLTFEYHDRAEEGRNEDNDIYTGANGPQKWLQQPYSTPSALVDQYALPRGTFLNLCVHHCVGSDCAAYDYDPPATGTGDLAPYMANAVVIHDLHGRTRIQYLDATFNVMREVAVDTGEITDYGYLANGMLVAVRKANGERTCIERDAQNRVTQSSVVPAPSLPGNPITQATVYSYDAAGQLLTIVHDALGTAWRTVFTRDTLERVKQMDEDVRPGAPQLHTYYDYSGEAPPVNMVLVTPTKVTYPSQRYDTFSSFDFSMGGPQTTVIDAGSATPERRYTRYDSYGRVIEDGEVSRFAKRYLFTDSTDPWRVTTIGHHMDPSQAWVDTTLASHVVDGETVIDSMVGPLRTTKLTNVGHLASQTDLIATVAPAGTSLPATQTRCFNLSADGRVEAEIAPEGNGVVYQYGYTTAGTSVTSQRGFGVATTDAWAAGCRGHVTPPNDPGLSQPTTRTYKPGGFPDTDTDENGVQHKYTTDGLGRVLQIDTSDSGHGEPVPAQQFGYDSAGHRIWEASRVPGTAYGRPALPDATVLSYSEFDYDFRDRIIAERRFAVETNEQIVKTWVYDDVAGTVALTDRGITTTTTYDGRGRVARTLLPDQSVQTVVHNLGSDVTTVQSNSNGNVTRTYNYDTRGQLVGIVDSNNVSLYQASWDDDGNQLSETRAGLGPTTWKYDSFGRMAEEDKTVSTSPTTVIAVSKYGYDRNNRLTQYADPKNSGSGGVPWTMTFTGLDAPLTITDTLTRQGSYQYLTGPTWSRSLAAMVTEPNGRVSSFQYDSEGRVTDVFSAPCGTARNPWECPNGVAQLQRHLVYDARGFVSETDAPGRATVQMTHDSLGRVVDDNVGTESTIHHSWTDAGRTRVTQVKWNPTGATATLTHRRDSMDRLHTVELAGQATPLATWDYGVGVGGPLSLSYSNGAKTTYTYDAKLRQTGLDVTYPAGSTSLMYSMHEALGADSIARLRQRRIGSLAPATDAFEVDAGGRVIAENENIPGVLTLPSGEVTNSQADAVLIKTANWSRYDLDTIGNITTRRMKTTTLMHTIDNYSRLTALAGIAVGHDNEDDLTGKTGDTKFSFDAFKATLASATTTAGTITYTYDAMNRLRGEQVPKTAAQVFVWDGTQLVAHGASNGPTLDVGGDDIDQHVVSIDGFGSGSQWFYHQGPTQSVFAVSGSTGLVEAYTYSAFGELLTITNRTGGTLTKSSFGNIFQWEGQHYDAATATYSMRARQYSPAWGTFLSPDPAGTRGGASLYAFAGSRALQHRDPLGMLPDDAKWVREWMSTWNAPFAAPWSPEFAGAAAAIPDLASKENVDYAYDEYGQLHKQEFIGRWEESYPYQTQPNGTLDWEVESGSPDKWNVLHFRDTIVDPSGEVIAVSELAMTLLGPLGSVVAKTTFQEYVKGNPETGQVYHGRTSGEGTPEQNVQIREASPHHMNEEGYDPAELELSSKDPDAIRGAEQILMELSRALGITGNRINGISPRNVNSAAYREAAMREFSDEMQEAAQNAREMVPDEFVPEFLDLAPPELIPFF
jgi:RHS repeat-associated protein